MDISKCRAGCEGGLKMDNERLIVLLQNALDLLRYEAQFNDDTAFKLWVTDELGMTDEEFSLLENEDE